MCLCQACDDAEAADAATHLKILNFLQNGQDLVSAVQADEAGIRTFLLGSDVAGAKCVINWAMKQRDTLNADGKRIPTFPDVDLSKVISYCLWVCFVVRFFCFFHLVIV